MIKSSEEIIRLFHDKLRSDRINKTNNFRHEIETHYFQILEILVEDYPTYRKHFPKFLGSLEQNDAIAYSISIFFRLYDNLLMLSSDDIIKIDQSILNEEITDQTFDKLLQAIEECFKSNKTYRISECNFNFENFTHLEMRGVVSSLIDSLQGDSKTIEWTAEQGQRHMLQLVILKSLLDSLGATKHFYFAVSMFLDRLNSSEYFQAARDVAEEIIIASFKDNCSELGFLNSYHCYSRQGSIHAAILYANMSLYNVNRYEKPLLDKYIKEIIWEAIKCFRNTKIYPFVIKIYENIPKSLQFSDYERRSIDHSYFSSLIATKNEKLPNKILYYLHKERESILRAGINEALPWLLILHNVKRLYPDANFSSTGLGYYFNIFETIVPRQSVEKYVNIINGSSIHNKGYLKSSLIKLNETRNENDIVYDNKHALIISSRLIEDSFKAHDKEAVLLAMILKSDFSLIFQSKETSAFRPFELPISDLQNSYSLYADHEQLTKNLSSSEHELIVWIAVTEGKVFQLSLINSEFVFSDLTTFKWDDFHDLKKSNYFSSLSFDDTIKDKFGVREVSTEEHLSQQDEIKRKLAFSRLSSVKNSCELLIIKDMKLARFPHNLMLDEGGNFIHSSKPIANILSTEWYLSCKGDNIINNDLTKSIWIPTKSGDFTLNKLHDSLKSELEKHQFKVFNQIDMVSPLSSDLNIVCSHGAKDIASNQVIYPGDSPLENLGKIVGSGEILIFFVCHSGSYKNEYFRNNITSLVKTYITLGYKAVIAPFWSLHINIPKIWLSTFILSLYEGLSINYSVFKANKSVSEEYQTPAAWACMHLYGNPHLVIKRNNDTE